MKKIITLSLVSALSTMLLVGCGSATPTPEAHTNDFHEKHLTHAKIHKIIKKAAQKDGWKITEFKNNAFIAEKFNSGEAISTTITFNKDYFDISPKNSDLENTINDALEK